MTTGRDHHRKGPGRKPNISWIIGLFLFSVGLGGMIGYQCAVSTSSLLYFDDSSTMYNPQTTTMDDDTTETNHTGTAATTTLIQNSNNSMTRTLVSLLE